MNEIKVFSFNQNEVRTLQINGEPYFVLADVCKVLELTTPKKVADRLDADEKGVSLIHTLGGNQKMTVITESGLYAVILRSDKPQAKGFRKWVTAEVLPTLRKTGSYTVKPTDDSKARMLATREENVRIRKAQLLYKVSKDCKVETYQQVLHSHIASMLTRQQLLPLPKADKTTYSASEIGDMLGITANKVGKLTNRYSLKNAEYGEWVWDKSPNSSHQCRTFRYYIGIVAMLRELLAKEVA